MSMILDNLVHLKPLLLILTAAGGTAIGGAVTTTYALSVYHQPASFQLTINPNVQGVLQNTTATSTVIVTSIGRFSGAVSLTLVDPGQTFSASVNPAKVNVRSGGTASSTLTFTAPMALGNYTVLIIGAGSSRGRTIYESAILTVQVASTQDFTITASPNNIVNTMGETNTTTITVASLKGYTGNVSLTYTSPFGYFTITTGQSLLKIASGGTATSTLTLTTGTQISTGNYTITVTGTDGARTHSVTINIQVVDPAIPPFIQEGLNLNSYTFKNSTMLTLNLQNTGNGTITITSYLVSDGSGDAYSLTNYAGPTIEVSSAGTATILIGSSCPTCIYTGITGLFTQFQLEHTYYVTVTTARDNEFTFQLVY
jgi:hypothetical protein